MFPKKGESLVDPNKPTQSTWLRINGSLVRLSNGGTSHSSTSTAASSVFDGLSARSTVSTTESVPNNKHDLIEPSADQSRFSTSSIDNPPPPTTSLPNWCWNAGLVRTLGKNIQESALQARLGYGVQFTLDINNDGNLLESNLKVLMRKNATAPPIHSISEIAKHAAESQSCSKAPSPLLAPKSMETQENGSAVAQPVLTMQSSATQFLDLATLTLSTQTSSPHRHSRMSECHSVTTIASLTSEEERKQKPWGKDIFICLAHSTMIDERLFALLDTASHCSWVSLEALHILGVSEDIRTDGEGIQPVTDNSTETITLAGKMSAYGKIKLSYRCTAGPMSIRRYKAWFRVANHSDTPFQVLLGQDYPDLQAAITNLNFVALSHPRTKAQKKLDEARAREHQARRERLEEEKVQEATRNASESLSPNSLPDILDLQDTPVLPDKRSDETVDSSSRNSTTTT